MVSYVAYATFSISDSGKNFLEEDSSRTVMLPILSEVNEGKSSKSQSIPRRGNGCHALATFLRLISDMENWYVISNSDGYNFPGIFNEPYPKRLGYCKDITLLPNYEKTDPHFMFSDIQLGKGKARPKRVIAMDVGGNIERVYYRFVPCGGVKLCGMHIEGCKYLAPTSSIKPCSQHPNASLKRTENCPVLFFYAWPENSNDNRRWLTGIVRSGNLESNNLHNHPIHSESKIPVKVDSDIRRAVVENPHLKTTDLIVGMLPYTGLL